jgi:hypothetical protein
MKAEYISSVSPYHYQYLKFDKEIKNAALCSAGNSKKRMLLFFSAQGAAIKNAARYSSGSRLMGC